MLGMALVDVFIVAVILFKQVFSACILVAVTVVRMKAFLMQNEKAKEIWVFIRIKK